MSPTSQGTQEIQRGTYFRLKEKNHSRRLFLCTGSYLPLVSLLAGREEMSAEARQLVIDHPAIPKRIDPATAVMP
jgi:hypothetical protein